MGTQLSKVKFQQFVKQAKGMRVAEIHVNRMDKKKHVVLQYNGRLPKGKSRLTGKWEIPREDREESAVVEDIKGFLAMARKHFFVHRGQGLEDEGFADAEMEAKGTPIKKG